MMNTLSGLDTIDQYRRSLDDIGTTSSSYNIPSTTTDFNQSDLHIINKTSVKVKQSGDTKLISDVLKSKFVVPMAHKNQCRSPPSLPKGKCGIKQSGPKTLKLISDSQHYIDLPENTHELCKKHGIKFNKKLIVKIKPLTFEMLTKYDSRGELKEYFLNNKSCNSNYKPSQSLQTLSNDHPVPSLDPVVNSIQTNLGSSKVSTTSNLKTIPINANVRSCSKDLFNCTGTAACASIPTKGCPNFLSKPDFNSQIMDVSSLSCAKDTPFTSNTCRNFLKVRPLSSLQDVHRCNLNQSRETIFSTSSNLKDGHTLHHLFCNLTHPEFSSETCLDSYSSPHPDSSQIAADPTSTSISDSISKLDLSKIVVKTSSTFKEPLTIKSAGIIIKALPLVHSRSLSFEPSTDQVDKLLLPSEKTNGTVLGQASSSHDILSPFYSPKPNEGFKASPSEINVEGFLGFDETEQNNGYFETFHQMPYADEGFLGFQETEQRYSRTYLRRRVNMDDKLRFRAYKSKLALLKNGFLQKAMENRTNQVVGPSKHSKAFYDFFYGGPHSQKHITTNKCSLSCRGSSPKNKRLKIDLSKLADDMNLNDSFEIKKSSTSKVNWSFLTNRKYRYTNSSQLQSLLPHSTSSRDPLAKCKFDHLFSEENAKNYEREKSFVATTNANLASFLQHAIEEIKTIQKWKFQEYEKMQKEIALIEEQKVILLRKVLHRMS